MEPQGEPQGEPHGETQGGDPAAPAPTDEGAARSHAWPSSLQSPAEARWTHARLVGRYEDFLRCSVDWLWETDAALVLSYVSSPVALKLGLPAQVLIGRPLPSLGRFEAPAGGEAPDPLKAPRPFRDAAFVMTGAAHREVAYLLSGVPYYDDDGGRFAGFRGTATVAPTLPPPAPAPRKVETPDPELAALSQALEEALLRNADLDWRLARLGAAADVPNPQTPPETPPAAPQASPPASPQAPPLSRTAHELRTPLNAVMGYADLGLNQVFGPLGERYLDCFRTIREAGRHMDELVGQLQDTATQPEHGGLASEVVEIAGVVAKAKAMVALAARNAEVDIARVGPLAGGQVIGDHRACTQILLNLLSNGVKFTPPGGSIGLETVVGPDNTLQVVVWDSGTGIALEEQRKIFEADYRAEAVRIAGKIPGHGLGLAISRDLARAMGGELSVVSQPGQGSRFILSLPLAGSAPAPG